MHGCLCERCEKNIPCRHGSGSVVIITDKVKNKILHMYSTVNYCKKNHVNCNGIDCLLGSCKNGKIFSPTIDVKMKDDSDVLIRNSFSFPVYVRRIPSDDYISLGDGDDTTLI